MNRLSKIVLILLLVAGMTAPSTLVKAKTIEDVPTTESSILSRTADPIKASQERLAQEETESSDDKTEESSDKKTEDSTEESKTKDSSDSDKESSTEETKGSTTDSSTETTDSSKEKTKKNSRGLLRADTDKLVEGTFGVTDPADYDIDKTLSAFLRSTQGTSYVNTDFAGRGKGVGQLTFGDMKTLKLVNLSGVDLPGVGRKAVVNIKGLEFANNLEDLGGYRLSESVVGDSVWNVNLYPKLNQLKMESCTDLTEVKLNQCVLLKKITVSYTSSLSVLDLSNAALLTHLDLRGTSLSEIDLTNCSDLIDLLIDDNSIRELDVTQNTKLVRLWARNNKYLKYLNVQGASSLRELDATGNQISDITPAYGLTSLVGYMRYLDQNIYAPVKLLADQTEMEIDILKTTSHKGLSVGQGTVTGSPVITIDGDKIKLSNISGSSIDGKYLTFNYDPAQILEGNSSQTQTRFTGKIYFSAVSDLDIELKRNKEKVPTGEKVTWEYELANLTAATAKEITSNIALPPGLTVVPGSIKHDGVTVADSYFNSPISFSDITAGNTSKITFETTAIGNAEDWLKVTSRVDWNDSTEFGPYHENAEASVQIQDDEQTHTPEPTKEMGILSVPIRFDYGIKDISKTDQVYSLSPDLYQSNTNVVSKGFYTRVKDDRDSGSSTGWSLSARLSNFVDVNNPSSGMPDSYGTALQLDGMSIEAIKDRDTANEAIDPSPSGTPSTVESSATIIAGESAKTLVSAQPLQGLGTWQLRIPFDKVSLKIPAHAGKENSNYRAKLTWSLDDVPA